MRYDFVYELIFLTFATSYCLLSPQQYTGKVPTGYGRVGTCTGTGTCIPHGRITSLLIKYLDGIGWIGSRYETAYPRVNGSTPLGARISISPPTPRSRRGGENSAETRGRLSRLFHYMFLLLVLFCIQ